MMRAKTLSFVVITITFLNALVAFAASEEATSKKPPQEISISTPKKIALPKMLDLGAGKCKQCIEMAPMLEELKRVYADRVEVEFIDLWKHQDMGEKYNIEVMPTQIFFDASGKEVFRHEGVMLKEEIITKWKQLGFKI